MKYSEEDRLTALAGIYQAAWCAQNVARRGMADGRAMETCIHSVFQTDARDVAEVFGGTEQIAPGLRQCVHQLRGGGGRDLELTRYFIALLQLERKLASDPAMQKRIGDGIDAARTRLAHFNLLHGNILAHLADIYSSTVSTLKPRIMVRGEALHLQNPDNANKIRALLLAGIRAAWLWRQTGGRRRQFLLQRNGLLAAADRMLAAMD